MPQGKSEGKMGISDDIRPRKPMRAAASHNFDVLPIKKSKHSKEDEEIDDTEETDELEEKEVEKEAKEKIIEKIKDDDEVEVKHLDKEEIRNSFFQYTPSRTKEEIASEKVDKAEKKENPDVVINLDKTAKKFDHLLNIFLWIVCGLLLATLVYINFSEIKGIFVKEETKTAESPKVTISKPELEVYSGTTTTGSSATTGVVVAPVTTGIAITTGTTATPIADTTINKKLIKMSVLNGNGITNSAVVVKNALVKAGFTVSAVANAKKFTYATTVIYYKTGKEAEAELVKAALPTRSVTTEPYDSIGSYDLQVVVGKK